PSQRFVKLDPLLRPRFQQSDLLSPGCIAQRHVFDVKHRIVAEVSRIISMLCNQMINFLLQRGAPADEKGAQHFRPFLVNHFIHRKTPGEWYEQMNVASLLQKQSHPKMVSDCRGIPHSSARIFLSTETWQGEDLSLMGTTRHDMRLAPR